MSSDDLKAHAASSQDFYELLDLRPAATEKEIGNAYRRRALKFHPDKIQNPTPADIERFHLLQVAKDVLTDPAVRQLYDNAREARLRKQRERDQMDAAKRKMREDLESAERTGAAGKQGFKRSWDNFNDDAEAKLQREVERIAEDGRRRRREAADKLKQELEEEELKAKEEEEQARKEADRGSQRVDRSQNGGANVPTVERTIKVRWQRERLDLDTERLKALFLSFGKIEGVSMLKDKRKRVEGKREKVTIATGVVVFESIVGAHAAVLDSEKKLRQAGAANGDWAHIESVDWASGAPPDLKNVTPGQSAPNPASSEGQDAPAKQDGSVSSTQQDSQESEKPPKPKFSFPGVNSSAPKSGKAPSFGSFASAAASSGKGTPSFQETVMMRLKNAQREKERKALEEQLAREDEAADANVSS